MTDTHRLCITLLLFNSLLGASPSAEEVPAGPVVELADLTVIGSSANVERLPGAGTFIDPEQIQNQTYTDINRVLFQVPGVTVRQEDGYGLFANVSLRGADTTRSAKLTLMEDGVLTAPAPYSAPSAYYTPSAGRMSALEVLKGSSQIAYGPHTTSGVINNLSTSIDTARPGYLKVMAGSFNEWMIHFHYAAATETKIGVVGGLIENYFHRADGFKTIDTTPDFQDGDRTGFQKNEPMLKLFWEPATEIAQRIDFKVGLTDFEADETYLGLSDDDFAADPFRRYAASRFDHIDTDSLRSSLRYVIEPTDRLHLEATAYTQTFSRNWFKLRRVNDGTRNVGLSEAVAGGGTALDILKAEGAGRLDYRNNNRDYSLSGLEARLRYRFETGDWAHQIEAGIRLHQDDVRRFQQDESFTQDAEGVIIDHQVGVPGGGGNRFQESRALAFDLQDRIRIGRLTVIPGIRHERIQYDYTDYDTEGSPEEITGSGSSDLNVFLPGIGFTFGLKHGVTLYGGAYRGMSVPGPRAAARSGIEPERSTGYELGTRYRNDGGFFIDATLFYTDFSDLLVIDNIGGAGSGTTENVGDVNSYGLELTTGYDFGRFIGPDWQLPLRLVLTTTSATLDGDANSTDPESIFSGGKDGNKVPYIPDTQVHLAAALEKNGAGLYLNMTLIDSTYASASNTDSLLNPDGVPDARFGTTDGAILIDLTVRYPVAESVRLFAGIRNLLDENYLTSRHPEGPRPGQPRNWNGGVEWRF